MDLGPVWTRCVSYRDKIHKGSKVNEMVLYKEKLHNNSLQLFTTFNEDALINIIVLMYV
jgi:hypothetical protein